MLTPQITVALLEGSREPQSQEEKDYLAFIGGTRGPRASWPRRTKTCTECGRKFEAIGFPTPTVNQWFFHKVCKDCKAKAERAEEVQFLNREARARERAIEAEEAPAKKRWTPSR